MKKFLALILVIVAIYLVYTQLWLPYQESKKKPVPSSSDVSLPVQPPASKPSTDGILLFEQGKYSKAIDRLQWEIEHQKTDDLAQHLSYLARAYERTEKDKRALETWGKIIQEHPESVYCGDAYYEIGRKSNDIAKRISYWEKAVTKFPESQGAKAAGLELGEIYLASNLPDKEYKARHYLSLALKSNIPQEKVKEIKQKLVELNKKLVFSPFPTPDSEIYTVQPGDTIDLISRRYKVEPGGAIAMGHIRRVNNLKSDRIHPGDKLKIITSKFHLEVSNKDLVLILYLNGDFIKEYPVAIGKEKNQRPVGRFHIGGKVAHPPWTVRHDDGTSEIIPYSDKRNILGSRWMGLKERPRLGIHGTTQPETIGKRVTDGCIRMHNAYIEEIYDLISEGAEIIIVE